MERFRIICNLTIEVWHKGLSLNNIQTLRRSGYIWKAYMRPKLGPNWAFHLTIFNIPYVPPSSVCFQIGIWSPKQHLFDREFCVGLPQTLCKQWTKGFCKILKFWPLHSVRQNIAGFRRGLFTCFLGHTPLLTAFWATTVIMGCGPKSRL